MTTAYLDKIPTSGALFRGNLPTEAHFHVKYYSKEELPFGNMDSTQWSVEELDQRLSNWLQSKWFEKEQLLKDYYGIDKFLIFKLVFFISMFKH